MKIPPLLLANVSCSSRQADHDVYQPKLKSRVSRQSQCPRTYHFLIEIVGARGPCTWLRVRALRALRVPIVHGLHTGYSRVSATYPIGRWDKGLTKPASHIASSRWCYMKHIGQSMSGMMWTRHSRVERGESGVVGDVGSTFGRSTRRIAISHIFSNNSVTRTYQRRSQSDSSRRSSSRQNGS